MISIGICDFSFSVFSECNRLSFWIKRIPDMKINSIIKLRNYDTGQEQYARCIDIYEPRENEYCVKYIVVNTAVDTPEDLHPVFPGWKMPKYPIHDIKRRYNDAIQIAKSIIDKTTE